MWDPRTGQRRGAGDVFREHGITPLVLKAKEGLALINGTQLITSVGSEAALRAERVARQADVVCAMTLEALRGSATPFNAHIHRARPHRGQIETAARIRVLLGAEEGLERSPIARSHANCNKVQDSYTLRCVPQVHGVVHDSVRFVKNLLTVEMNSATDNPMIFPDVDRSGTECCGKQKDEMAAGGAASRQGIIISGGNFHGEYPAKACDMLAIAIHEIGSIAERRIERLVNPDLSGLPAFLVREGGLNSGFMIAHCTAAALVSENKVLCHPASVDSISTSAAQEDHVSMGGFAARKALQVVSHVEFVLAVELLAACQGLDLLLPLRTTAPLQAVHALVRSKVGTWERDRYMTPDIEAVATLLRENKIWEAVAPFMQEHKHKQEQEQERRIPAKL